ncbi:shikimate dehydrogenase family protein [Mycolicibacterium vaccae]|uniref:shikimate dehydrogenase family protein n=2 Tax=Mycolicibacterium vaccae TaxID=1810 RepID=UPI0007DD2CBC|nr:hypothetical protein [Mycolicibacterium vaccae]ANI38796.1 shikimate 5-dehydrogenase [Mycolicibacterium vaccae 95051]MCV7061659.1 hypothetical protein [Mycolicibacterium vaccae]
MSITETPAATTSIVDEFCAQEMGSVPAPSPSGQGTVRLAAIGTTAAKPLSSPLLRRALADVGLEVSTAEPFPDARSLIADTNWDIGIVLSPFKIETASLVGDLSPSAQATGVVDTVFARPGRAFGANSNVWAVRAVLRRLIGGTPPNRVLVLGSGGSTRSVLLAVQREWPDVDAVISARDLAKAEPIGQMFGARVAEAAGIAELAADVIINTTTWGETAASEDTPFAFDLPAALRPGAAYFDLNNRRSSLVEQALDAGCVVMSGTYMQRITHHCRAAGMRRWMDAR